MQETRKQTYDAINVFVCEEVFVYVSRRDAFVCVWAWGRIEMCLWHECGQNVVLQGGEDS